MALAVMAESDGEGKRLGSWAGLGWASLTGLRIYVITVINDPGTWLAGKSGPFANRIGLVLMLPDKGSEPLAL